MDRSPHTRLIALLGDPVEHSLSPVMQNAAFRAAGVDGVYLALRCDDAALPGLLRGIARAGGAGNVTVPHKVAAAAILDHATVAVERTGACNTFWLEDGSVCGDNTDVAGFDAAVRDLVGSPAGARVLLLGAGGAARAVALALLDARADSIWIRNRSPEHARLLQEALDPGRMCITFVDPEEPPGGDFDLVVNATSLGLDAGDARPVDLERLGRVGAVMDLVYAPGGTAWVRSARERGVRAADGLGMLVAQGAASFRHWWDRPAPVDAMRSALEGAM
ncbi:MAG: shikimate dehydrogenase [Gemmatimonadota bacterium]|jgi:shikimate dehydrogenase